MADLDLNSDVWTPLQRLHWRELMTPLCGIISLVLCVFAQIVYFKFPRLRVFPRSILSWLNIYNMLFSVYIIWKWLPASSLHQTWAVAIDPKSIACRLSLFLDNFTMAGLVASDTLIAFTVFLVVKFPGHMEAYTRRYFWGYLLYNVAFPSVLGILASLSIGPPQGTGNSCAATQSIQPVLTWFMLPFFGVQLILAGIAMFHVRRVMNAVHALHSTNFPFSYLVARFMITFAAQSFNIIPVEIYVTFPKVQLHARFARFAFTSHAIGGGLDALVFVIVNPDFVEWLKHRVAKLRYRFRKWRGTDEFKHSNYTPPAMIELDTNYGTSETEQKHVDKDEESGISSAVV